MTELFKIRTFGLDDDDSWVLRVKRALASAGVDNVEFFDNHHDFFDNFDEHVHIAIIDHSLGPVTGMDVMKRVLKINRLCFCIIMSGNLRPATIIEYFVEGARNYIYKDDPEFDEKLVASVQKAYGKFSDIIQFYERQKEMARKIETKANANFHMDGST